MIRPHPDQSLAARKGTLPGKLQDVLTPAGWGRKKLELATWGRCGLERWGQEHLAETNWRSLVCSCSCSFVGWGCWPRSCQLVMGSYRRAVAGSPRRSPTARSRCIRCSSPYRRRSALFSGCSTGVARGESSIWTCWRSLASFPWRCCSATMSPKPVCGWQPSVSAGCSAACLERPLGYGGCRNCAHPSAPDGWAILILLLVRIGSVAAGNILDVGQASSLGAWRVLHGLHLYGAVSWPGPGGLRIYRPDSYGPFAYYAYIPFVATFPLAPAVIATLLSALCFDALTLAGLHTLGRRLGGRPLAQASVFAYLLYPFPDLSLMAETNDGLIAALCVWTIVVATERPVARGLLMAAATLTKFVPALLALQFLGERRGRWRYALALAASLAG